MENKKHIVIVGGGFAGLELVKVLNRSGKYKITLVDMNNTSAISVGCGLYGAFIYLLPFPPSISQV